MNKELKKYMEEEFKFLDGLKGLKQIDLARGRIEKRKHLLAKSLGFENAEACKINELKGFTKEDKLGDIPFSGRVANLLRAYSYDVLDGNYREAFDMKVKEFEGVSLSSLLKLRGVGITAVNQFADILTALKVNTTP
jgi:hypothetical protein